MLNKLPSNLVAVICFILLSLNVISHATQLVFLALVRLAAPAHHAKRFSALAERIYCNFIKINGAIFELTNNIDWQINWPDDLSKKESYLVISNHMSWVDIIFVMQLLAAKAPAPRFFLKQQLIWVPFIGIGAWALDMPFMRRYSKETIARHPHLKGKDIETTRQACEKFKDHPTTVVNFVEGTRNTPKKHQQQNSPYQHLLRPKAGGIAFTLATMGQQFDKVIHIDLVYPQRQQGSLVHQLLTGKLGKVMVNVTTEPVAEELIGDYANDAAYRIRFQRWLNATWREKDRRIDALLKQHQEEQAKQQQPSPVT